MNIIGSNFFSFSTFFSFQDASLSASPEETLTHQESEMQNLEFGPMYDPCESLINGDDTSMSVQQVKTEKKSLKRQPYSACFSFNRIVKTIFVALLSIGKNNLVGAIDPTRNLTDFTNNHSVAILLTGEVATLNNVSEFLDKEIFRKIFSDLIERARKTDEAFYQWFKNLPPIDGYKKQIKLANEAIDLWKQVKDYINDFQYSLLFDKSDAITSQSIENKLCRLLAEIDASEALIAGHKVKIAQSFEHMLPLLNIAIAKDDVAIESVNTCLEADFEGGTADKQKLEFRRSFLLAKRDGLRTFHQNAVAIVDEGKAKRKEAN